MNRKELIDAVAAKSGLTKADTDKTLSAVLEVIETTLKKGGDVTLVGFGSFGVTKRAARNGRNPATGATIKIPATKAVKFKVGAGLKKAVAK